MVEQDPSRPLGGEKSAPLLRLFGVDVATDFPFRTHLEPGHDPAQLRFTCNPPAQLGDTNVLGEPLYSSPWKSDSGESHLSLFEAGAGAFVLSFPETANFSVGADEVVAQPARAAEPRAVEIGFLGVVMSFWLELQRIPTLHASAPNARKPVAPLPHLAQGAAGLAGLAILMAPPSVQRRNQLTQPCRVREVALLTGSQIAHVVAQKSLIFLNLPRFAPDTDKKRGAMWCHFSHLQTRGTAHN